MSNKITEIKDDEQKSQNARELNCIFTPFQLSFCSTDGADGQEERARRVELAEMGKRSSPQNRVPLKSDFTAEDRGTFN